MDYVEGIALSFSQGKVVDGCIIIPIIVEGFYGEVHIPFGDTAVSEFMANEVLKRMQARDQKLTQERGTNNEQS